MKCLETSLLIINKIVLGLLTLGHGMYIPVNIQHIDIAKEFAYHSSYTINVVLTLSNPEL